MQVVGEIGDFPSREHNRINALRRYDILDSPPDGSFDRITALAANLFGVPISIISLVDTDRIWFKSHHGLEVEEIDRDLGLCASCIMQNTPWVLTDAKIDVRSLANPLVAGEFGLRFYLGVPLQTHDGYNLGTLCVIDKRPREVTEREISQLTDLASVVMDEIELRLSARATVAQLQKVIAEKELMAREVDHRAMNGLQVVASLLKLQVREAEGVAAEQLTLAANRVAAIGRAHQHIFQTQEPGRADCLEYLKRLCNDLSGVLNINDLTVDGSTEQIATESIVPLGLIVTELVSNAAKNGAKSIQISLNAHSSERNAISVTDDGQGLPFDFDPTKSVGLGMKVILAMV
ncbi:MAG TPA: histidine kinase dimerization/phosphoacceptor domain -containing protein, partial [Pirellula sp.]|nr:histidine kinase dimerization/phosphoacceptor domain -containing protein [Pirellula sp.]